MSFHRASAEGKDRDPPQTKDGASRLVDEGGAPSPTIAFDGACGLCSTWVRFVLARDARKRFRFASNRSIAGAAIFRASGHTVFDPSSMIFIDARDRRYEKSDAAIRICADMGGVLRLALIANLIPRRLRDAGYDFVARNRYRLFSTDEACLLPPADRMDQFLP